MGLLAICQPLPVTVVAGSSSAGTGLANVLTPAPKEAFVSSAGGAVTIALDLGAAADVDTFFLGFTGSPAGAAFTVTPGLSGGSAIATGAVAGSYRRAPLRHAGVVLAAAVNSRYFRLSIAAAGPLAIAIAAIGKSIRPSSGYDLGWGRPIADASRVERLFDGGFGWSPGGIAGGFQWTLPALTDDERERLYALSMDVGIGGELLVFEDPDATLVPNESMHWGKLAKLEPFARSQPGESKWDLQVQDWPS